MTTQPVWISGRSNVSNLGCVCSLFIVYCLVKSFETCDMDWKFYFILNVFVVAILCTSVESVFKNITKRQAKFCKSSSEFRCAGRCISKYEVCDGTKHCTDGSDETSTACKLVSITSCPQGSFQCHYGACIRENLQCNRRNDCSDASDEIGCPESNGGSQTSLCDSYSEFYCAGRCISKYEVCDGTIHCTDDSDETRAACIRVSITSCPPESFQCSYGACISLNLQCNNKKDCADGSDEFGCLGTDPPPLPLNVDNAPTSVCNSVGGNQKYKECNNGECVDQYSFCDGVVDCSDRSDETETACYNLFRGVCGAGQWRCAYGACLRLSVRCDGRKDCWDNSDEADCPTPSPPPPPKPSRCEAGQWRCAYGACLPLSARCDGRKDCWDNSDEADCPTPSPAPPPPKNTSRRKMCVIPNPANNRHFERYSCQTESCSLLSGQTVPDEGLVVVTCDPQHQLDHLDSHSHPTHHIGPHITGCKDGVWFPDMPHCSKLCPSLESNTLDLTCYQGPAVVNCNNPMLTETIVQFKCREHYEMNSNQLNMIRCNASGQWSGQLPQCTAKCGQSNLNIKQIPTIIGGTVSKVGDFPWFAGIYLRQTNRWEASCGGTLINRQAVLTAAHCVTSQSRVEPPPLPVSDVRVTLGKYYRDWDTVENTEIRLTVKRIVVHPSYRGAPQQYREDIAVLFLDTEVEVNSYVMPACVDFNFLHTNWLTQSTNIFGYIAGWGNTGSCGTFGTICNSQSDVLLHTRTNIMPFNECYRVTQQIYPSPFSTLTSDKYCAGNGTVSVVQQGDSGGGHTFVINRAHYIYGIVSTKLKLEAPNKPFYSFAALTNVSFHMEWLRNQLF